MAVITVGESAVPLPVDPTSAVAIQNEGSGNLYVALGEAASATNGWKVPTATALPFIIPANNGGISLISDAASQSVRYLELPG